MAYKLDTCTLTIAQGLVPGGKLVSVWCDSAKSSDSSNNLQLQSVLDTSVYIWPFAMRVYSTIV